MSSPTASFRVLVVEDSPEDREFYRQILRNDDQFRLEFATTGADALALTEHGRFAACLLDHHLPDVDGLVLLEQLLAGARGYPIAAIVMVTGRGDEALAASAMKRGALDYLVKGKFGADLLTRTLHNGLSRASMAARLKEEHQDLLETRQKLLESLKVRAELVSIASHELRTPLTALQLKADAILRSTARSLDCRPPHDRLYQFFQVSVRQLGRLSRLLDDMLDFSRIESGHLHLQLDTVDVSVLTKNACEKFTESQSVCAIDAVVEDGLIARGDALRLEQILDNFVANALRYAPGKPVQISLQRQTDGFARLRVSDQGPGIPVDVQADIFNKFARAANKEVQGLGLGLFICRAIAEQHSGRIGVHSAPGAGAEFFVDLPLVDDCTERAAQLVSQKQRS